MIYLNLIFSSSHLPSVLAALSLSQDWLSCLLRAERAPFKLAEVRLSSFFSIRVFAPMRETRSPYLVELRVIDRVTISSGET